MDYQLRPDRDLTILIPARANSKRVPHKNVRVLGGKPLTQWTLDTAREAHAAKIIVSTDMEVVIPSGVTIHRRKPAHATDDATDFSWVYDLRQMIETPYFCILRPTSPFRTASTIRRAYAALVASKAHSVRAVERVTHPHPAKMWEFIPGSKYMRPIQFGAHADGTPWHSSPTQSLPPVYKQNSALEMAQTWVIEGTKTISGYHIAPFLTEALEGFSIDEESDFDQAERIVAAMSVGQQETPKGFTILNDDAVSGLRRITCLCGALRVVGSVCGCGHIVVQGDGGKPPIAGDGGGYGFGV